MGRLRVYSLSRANTKAPSPGEHAAGPATGHLLIAEILLPAADPHGNRAPREPLIEGEELHRLLQAVQPLETRAELDRIGRSQRMAKEGGSRPAQDGIVQLDEDGARKLLGAPLEETLESFRGDRALPVPPCECRHQLDLVSWLDRAGRLPPELLHLGRSLLVDEPLHHRAGVEEDDQTRSSRSSRIACDSGGPGSATRGICCDF